MEWLAPYYADINLYMLIFIIIPFGLWALVEMGDIIINACERIMGYKDKIREDAIEF